jgi:hypothetical protein
MNRTQLEQANKRAACIDACELNIAKYEAVKASKEIKILNEVDMVIIIGGKNKDTIMDMLIDEERRYMKQQQQELDKL